MPELPDLEVIRENLECKMRSHFIESAQVFRPKRVKPSAEAWQAGLEGCCVEGIMRRGKFIILQLSGGGSMLTHMMLSGELDWEASALPIGKNCTAVLRLANGYDLRFLDFRNWMKLFYLPPGELVNSPELNALGPEPFDTRFTLHYFQAMLAGYPGTAKYAMMDQNLLAGLGNAFTDEILFSAGILPMRKAHDLQEEEIQRLYRSIPDTLRWAITEARAGMAGGIRGEIRSYLRVHGKAGQTCPGCQGEIERIEIENRWAFFCRSCQH